MAMDIITGLPAYLQQFVHGLDHYHMIQAAVIALFFGIAASSIAGVIIVPVIAAIVYIAADAVIPPLLHHTAIAMPMFDKHMLQEALALYVFFLVAVAIIFVVKKLVLAVTGR
jgi:hypothetical protein